jgi:hypothetical protein
MDFDEFDDEMESSVGRDIWRGSARSVAEMRWYLQFNLATFADQLKAFDPSRNNLHHLECGGFIAYVGIIEIVAVIQPAAIVNSNGIRWCGLFQVAFA